MRPLTMFLLLLGLGALDPAPAGAQERLPAACGGGYRNSTTQHIHLYEDLFFSPESHEARQDMGIALLDATAPVRVVDEPGLCNRILETGLRILNDSISPPEHPAHRTTRATIEWEIIQFGPYYLLSTWTPQPEDGRFVLQQHSIVILLRVEDLCFVSWFLG